MSDEVLRLVCGVLRDHSVVEDRKVIDDSEGMQRLQLAPGEGPSG
jgi:hypothetical protein